jgi:hypothetical protein
MGAVVQVGYGSADVLEFKEIDRPVAADDEVLVRVHVASLAAAARRASEHGADLVGHGHVDRHPCRGR